MSELTRLRVERKFYMRSERAAEDYTDDLVDGDGRPLYLDLLGSVSGSDQPDLIWDNEVIQEQYRRFHNGS